MDTELTLSRALGVTAATLAGAVFAIVRAPVKRGDELFKFGTRVFLLVSQPPECTGVPNCCLGVTEWS